MTRLRSVGISLVLATLWPAAGVALAQIPEGYEVVRLTNDLGIHVRANINNRSEVVWSSSFPPTVSDVWLFSRGRRYRITSEGTYDIRPDINDAGEIAWMRGPNWTPPFSVILQSLGSITNVSFESPAESSLALNSQPLIVWPTDFSNDFSRVELFVFANGGVTQLTANGLSNAEPRISK